jgi:hypothetical protein
VGKRERRERRREERQSDAAAREERRIAKDRAEILVQRCPSCGGNEVARLQYGLPSLDAEMENDISAGLIVLAGCSFASDSPKWVCRNCKHRWGTLLSGSNA